MGEKERHALAVLVKYFQILHDGFDDLDKRIRALEAQKAPGGAKNSAYVLSLNTQFRALQQELEQILR
jgi:hypothetical protein